MAKPSVCTEIGVLQRGLGVSQPAWRTALPASSGCPHHQRCPQQATSPSPLGETRMAWAPSAMERARDRMGPNKQLARTELRSRSASGALDLPQEQKEASLPRGTLLFRRSEPATVNRSSKSVQGKSPRTCMTGYLPNAPERTWIQQTALI